MRQRQSDLPAMFWSGGIVELRGLMTYGPRAFALLLTLGLGLLAASVPAKRQQAIPTFLSGITANSREIFLRGRAMGNRANVFSKVGDSITASPYFLYDIGLGKYDLGDYAALAEAIRFFSAVKARIGNSFRNTPIAASAGWSSARLLQPGYNIPPECGSDSPLVCEYKLVKPAVALIMIGTNDWSEERLAVNLRQILDTTVKMGIIPVLSTIPPKPVLGDLSARVDAFNRLIRQLAARFDIPLWDYYAVMQSAPNGGIGPDGIHPSVPPDGVVARFTADNLRYGYTLRNLTALQVLDVLRRRVLQ